MELIDLSDKQACFPAACVTALGFFDGVHLGHRALLAKTAEEARARGMCAAVLTFRYQDTYKAGAARLTDETARNALFAACGITHVFSADFESLRTLSPVEFVQNILVGTCHTALALCGFNFHFGHLAKGDANTLVSLMEQTGGDALVLPPETLSDGTIVSSSAVRGAIEKGDMETAAAMLARPHSLTAAVLHGKALGRTIGIPTINQVFPAQAVIPAYGVYAVMCEVDGANLLGVANVGVRPTVNGDGVNCETHLIGFDGDLYDKVVTTHFLKMIRPERCFDSLDALREEIEHNKQEVIELYGN